MTGESTLKAPLWQPRSVEETQEIYREWAQTYDADVLSSGYATPARIAKALSGFNLQGGAVLDYGCGTGLSGEALRDAGHTAIDGTDISHEMLHKAVAKDIYRETWMSKPGAFDFPNGKYSAIVAAGVVSLGAAPPETLAGLVSKLSTGQILAFSYNDPTLAEQSYITALNELTASGRVELIFREHGPHLPEKGMGSEVILLKAK